MVYKAINSTNTKTYQTHTASKITDEDRRFAARAPMIYFENIDTTGADMVVLDESESYDLGYHHSRKRLFKFSNDTMFVEHYSANEASGHGTHQSPYYGPSSETRYWMLVNVSGAQEIMRLVKPTPVPIKDIEFIEKYADPEERLTLPNGREVIVWTNSQLIIKGPTPNDWLSYDPKDIYYGIETAKTEPYPGDSGSISEEHPAKTEMRKILDSCIEAGLITPEMKTMLEGPSVSKSTFAKASAKLYSAYKLALIRQRLATQLDGYVEVQQMCQQAVSILNGPSGKKYIEDRKALIQEIKKGQYSSDRLNKLRKKLSKVISKNESELPHKKNRLVSGFSLLVGIYARLYSWSKKR